MKTQVIRFVIFIASTAFLLTGCRKDLEQMKPAIAEQNVTTMDQLKVPDSFDWKTTQDVELKLTSSVRSALVIKSAAGVVYQKAILIPGESYNSILTLPTYESELTFVFNGNPVLLKIVNKKIEHTF